MPVNSTVQVCSGIKCCTNSIEKCIQRVLDKSEFDVAHRPQSETEYLSSAPVDIKLALQVFLVQLKFPVK